MVSTSATSQTEAVVSRHLQAFMARDLEALMADYTDDSVIVNNISPAPIRGLAAIRRFMEQVLPAFTPEVIAGVKLGQQLTEGEVSYLVWSAGETIPLATDTYVVRDGKLALQTAYVQMGAAT
jgi:ketosteroid isomerase-like protein